MTASQTTLERPLSRERSRTAANTSCLARYTDDGGREREIVRLPGAQGSALVVDRLAGGLGDARLVAHLCADEPRHNAHIVCSLYLSDTNRRCRALTDDDLRGTPPGLMPEQQTLADEPEVEQQRALVDPQGFVYELTVRRGAGVSELRWARLAPDGRRERSTLREVIGALQSYEPALTLTANAVQRYSGDREISVASLCAELDRITSSSVVLNRGLREAVLTAMQRESLTLSEIAIRCGRIKHDEKGTESGETSWLARRIGMLPEGGHEAPTPWVSSDVLALIAREGLGIAPRDVELA